MAHGGDLAAILQARAVAVDDAQLDAALRDAVSGPELAEWAATHLTDDTLLTLDELELYDALQRSGRDEQLAAASLDDSHGEGAHVALPVPDSELRAAIAALERSTEKIRKQTDVVRQQQEAVSRFEGRSTSASSAGETHTAFAARHHQRWDAARTDLAADVERLGRALDDRVGDLAQQNRALAQRVQQTVDGLCRSDDTLLASLQKLGWALPAHVASKDSAQDGAARQQQASIAQLRDICLHLIKFSVETIRTKLDWLYLEGLEAAEATTTTAPPSSTEDVATLQGELESLYAEILPVAQMSVEQQYLAPALKALSGKNAKNLTRSLLALDYIDECLAFLLEHLALLTARIDTAAAHYSTADTFLAAARTELAVQIPTTSARAKAVHDQRRRLSNYGSPVRRRLSTGASHMRTRSGTVGGTSSVMSADLKAQRRRSSGYGVGSFGGVGGSGPVSPIEQLLEGLSLILPVEDSLDGGLAGGVSATSVETATRINAHFLQATLADRAAKADGVAANAQKAFEAATTAPLADARRAEWLARASVLAESPFGAVQLVDPEIDGSIAVMADEVRRLAERRVAVEADLDKARRDGSAKREKIIARWA